MSDSVPADACSRTADNRIVFDSLIESACRAISESRFRRASADLQSAARFAWYNHPGLFRSSRLEFLAAQISEHLPRSKAPGPMLTGHVVHVLSQAYPTGGHTRLVWRWIENDNTHTNSVVLTGQQGIPVPHQLRDAVAASGGRIVSLGESTSNLLVRAAALRSIADSGAALIVLHVHPYDLVPSIGLRGVRARVIFLNHADHVFWIGGAIADVVADIRPAGQRLTMAQRNIPRSRTIIIPIPLSPPTQSGKQQAREQLGIPQDVVLLISIASGYKYSSAPGQHFIDIHQDFVLAHPEVRLIVIGPAPQGRWREVCERTSGRFRAIGIVEALDAYYDAADIYLDALPFASLTSLLDAAVRGVPVLALNETVADSVLTSNDLSLLDQGVYYAHRREYVAALETLAGQPELRRLQGALIRSAVERDHLPPGWNQYLDGLFKKVATLPEGDSDLPERRDISRAEGDRLDLALVDFQTASRLGEPLWACRLRDAPCMPIWDRLEVLMSVPARQRCGSLKYMLPDGLRSKMKVWLARLCSN